MAVDAIRLQNFMAFEDTDWIELRPITLLFGRNSSGKSAIIKALLLLRQSLNADPDKSQLLFFDPEGYDFGDFNSMLHQAAGVSRWRSDEEEDIMEGEITFGFRCSIADEEFTSYLNTVLTVQGREFGKKFDFASECESSYDLLLTFRLHKPPQSTSYVVVLSDIRILCPWIQSGNEPQILFEANNLFYIEAASDFDYQWYFNTEILYEHQLEGKQDLWTQLEVGTVSGFLPVIKMGDTSLATTDEIKSDVDCASSLLNKLGDQIKRFLKSINHVRPLRPEPRRVYALDEGEKKKWEKQGWGYFLDFLNEDLDQPKSTEINTWLQKLDLAAIANIVKSSRRLRDSVYSQLSLRELEKQKIKKEDITQKNLGKDHHPGFNIIDVGFGASQVLPIIVQYVLADPGAFIIIEQPELHLHPEAQAKLTDLIIAMASKEKLFLLETHSEHVLLRLQKRIVQTTRDLFLSEPNKTTKGYKLNKDQVKIIFVDREEPPDSSVKMLDIDEKARIHAPPPRFLNFFSQDSRDIDETYQALIDIDKSKQDVSVSQADEEHA